MPRRAYSYRRVSDPTQARGDGLDRQADFAARLCERHGWIMDDSLSFCDKGRSGFHGDHRRGKGQLLQFLEAVKRGRIAAGSVLIIENIDRLSREQMDEAHDLFKGILKSGIWIATEMPERVYKPNSLKTLLGTIEPLLHMYLAHEHSLKLSERIKDHWQRRRERMRQGVTTGGRRPSWIIATPNGYALHPVHGPTVRTIFRLAREGMGHLRILQYLNARPDEHPPLLGNGAWLRTTIASILRSRTTVGEYQPCGGHHVSRSRRLPIGPPIPNHYPAAVSEQEWTLAQAARRARTGTTGQPGKKETNLFTAIVFEATTGERMSLRAIVGGTPTSRHKYRYLVTGKLGESAANGNGCNYDPFEACVIRTIAALKADDVLPPDAARLESEARITALTGRVVALEHREAEVQHQIEDPENGAAVTALARSLAKLTAERTAATKELDALRFESQTGRGEQLGETQSLLTLLEEVKGTDQEADLRRKVKAALRWLVDSIWLKVQYINKARRIVHIQVFFRGGSSRYVQLLPDSLPDGVEPADYSTTDFRKWHIGDVTAEREALPQVR